MNHQIYPIKLITKCCVNIQLGIRVLVLTVNLPDIYVLLFEGTVWFLLDGVQCIRGVFPNLITCLLAITAHGAMIVKTSNK